MSDPRIERTRQHKLLNILTLAICAMIDGTEHWSEMQGTRLGSGTAERSPLRIVSAAWASVQSQLLGQVRTKDKSNEINDISARLKLLAIGGRHRHH